MPNLASQIRVAFSSMAWNTGSNSPGELTDDAQHLRVAVCCSKSIVGAAQFIEQPRVLDGDDGLGGEILHKLDLLVGEGPNLLTVDADDADQYIVLEHRHANGENARRRACCRARRA